MKQSRMLMGLKVLLVVQIAAMVLAYAHGINRGAYLQLSQKEGNQMDTRPKKRPKTAEPAVLEVPEALPQALYDELMLFVTQTFSGSYLAEQYLIRVFRIPAWENFKKNWFDNTEVLLCLCLCPRYLSLS